MSDLSQDGVPASFVEQVFETMTRADRHTFQLLTKRAQRMRDLVRALPVHLVGHPPRLARGERRRPQIRRAPHRPAPPRPAAVRFLLSIEPLLEDLGELDLTDIHWVIVGGEIGPGARPMDAKWVRSIRAQCRRQKVPFFFKQLGGVQKRKHGRTLDGRLCDEFPKPAKLSVQRRRRRAPGVATHVPAGTSRRSETREGEHRMARVLALVVVGRSIRCSSRPRRPSSPGRSASGRGCRRRTSPSKRSDRVRRA